MKPTHWLWGFPVASVGVALMTDQWPKGHLLLEYGPNSAATLMGIGITSLIVNKIIEANEGVERRLRRQLAARALRRSLDQIVVLVIALLRSGDQATQRPTTVDELSAWWEEHAIDIKVDKELAQILVTVTSAVTADLLSNRDRNDAGFPIGAAQALEAFVDDDLWRQASIFAQLDIPEIGMAFGGPQRQAEFGARLRALIDAYEAMAETPLAVRLQGYILDFAFKAAPAENADEPSS